ncbi:hypothetical protein D9M68_647140 [compost metagenome]
MLGQNGHRHLFQPAHELAEVADATGRWLHAFEQFDDHAEVLGEQSVTQCLLHQPGPFEPFDRAPMQTPDIRATGLQALAEELDEQRMQSVPLLTCQVHRLDEQITLLDRSDQRRRFGPFRDMGGDIGIEAPKDGELLQEIEQLARQVRHHVFRQIIREPRAAVQQGSTLHGLARIGPEGDGQELQADGPAVGQFMDRMHGVQIQALIQMSLDESQGLTEVE